MSKLKKTLLLSLVVLFCISSLSLLTLTGCKEEAVPTGEVKETAGEVKETAGEVKETAEAQEINLKVLAVSGPVSQVTNRWAERYMEKHPNVNIVVDTMEAMLGIQTIPSIVEAGEYYDFIFSTKSYAQWGDFFNPDNCLDLYPYLEERDLLKYFWPGLVSDNMDGDKMFSIALPEGLNPQKVMIYSKPVFDELGLEYPKRSGLKFEEFLNLIDTIKDSEYIPIPFGAADPYQTNQWFNLMMQRMNPEDIFAQYAFSCIQDVDVKWTDDVCFEAQKNVQLVSEAFQDGAVGTDVMTARSLFTGGKAAMYAAAGWEIGSLMKELDFEIGYFTFPTIDDTVSPKILVWNGTGYFVPSYVKEENIDTIIDFFEFALTDIENQKITIEESGNIPSNMLIFDEIVDLLPLPTAEVAKDIENFGSGIYFDYTFWPELQKQSSDLTTEVIGGLTDDKGIREGLEKMEAIAQKYRETLVK